MQKIELISIGDEILSGVTVNTNSSWLAAQLSDSGYKVRWITTIADNPDEIISALSHAAYRAQIIILTGGLGPTPDDITRHAIARYFKSKLVLHDPTLKHIQTMFEARGVQMPEININQAMAPQDAVIITNPVGTAPGLLLRQNNTLFFFLPGVPTEMKEIFSTSVLKMIKNEFPVRPVVSRLIRTTGLPESRLVEKINDILDDASSFSLSFLPKTSGVDIRITAQTADEGDELKPFVKRLRNRLSKYIYSESDLTLSEIVGQLLLEKKLTLSVAESFTGGLICDLLTNRPGSSEYFLGGAITYSNESKIHLLNVRPQTIEHHGAVSEQTALEMAEGVQRSFQSDCALSSTGIAGPTGATAQKPVGLCYLAAKYGTETEVRKFTFGKDRRMNKERGASAAFELLRRILTKV